MADRQINSRYVYRQFYVTIVGSNWGNGNGKSVSGISRCVNGVVNDQNPMTARALSENFTYLLFQTIIQI